MNKNKQQQEDGTLMGIYERYVARKKTIKDSFTELYPTGSADSFIAKDGTILQAESADDQSGKFITVKAPRNQSGSSSFSPLNSFGDTGRIGELPKDMKTLSDDPEVVVNEIVNKTNPFGTKYVISKHKK